MTRPAAHQHYATRFINSADIAGTRFYSLNTLFNLPGSAAGSVLFFYFISKTLTRGAAGHTETSLVADVIQFFDNHSDFKPCGRGWAAGQGAR